MWHVALLIEDERGLKLRGLFQIQVDLLTPIACHPRVFKYLVDVDALLVVFLENLGQELLNLLCSWT